MGPTRYSYERAKQMCEVTKEIVVEIFSRDLEAESARPGNVKPASFSVARTPDEIKATFDAAHDDSPKPLSDGQPVDLRD